MLKKLVSLFLAVSISLATFSIAYAKDEQISDYREEYHTVITDAYELEKTIADDKLTIPDGWQLEKVEKAVYIDSSVASSESLSNSEPEPKAILYRITNVNTSGSEFYFVNEYDIDIYQGPAGISTTYSKSEEVKKSINVSIGNGTVKAAVGYDITVKYTVSKNFTASVSAGKTLVVKVYPLYKRTTFDIYNKWTGNCVQQGAYTDKPVGIYITQYTYNT